jgi:hypothetical protein
MKLERTKSLVEAEKRKGIKSYYNAKIEETEKKVRDK